MAGAMVEGRQGVRARPAPRGFGVGPPGTRTTTSSRKRARPVEALELLARERELGRREVVAQLALVASAHYDARRVGLVHESRERDARHGGPQLPADLAERVEHDPAARLVDGREV